MSILCPFGRGGLVPLAFFVFSFPTWSCEETLATKDALGEAAEPAPPDITQPVFVPDVQVDGVEVIVNELNPESGLGFAVLRVASVLPEGFRKELFEDDLPKLGEPEREGSLVVGHRERFTGIDGGRAAVLNRVGELIEQFVSRTLPREAEVMAVSDKSRILLVDYFGGSEHGDTTWVSATLNLTGGERSGTHSTKLGRWQSRVDEFGSVFVFTGTERADVEKPGVRYGLFGLELEMFPDYLYPVDGKRWVERVGHGSPRYEDFPHRRLTAQYTYSLKSYWQSPD